MKTEQLGPYTLSWPDGVFPLGGDSLSLGAFATVKPQWRVCDLGTGSGTLLLLLARRANELSLTGVELHPLSAQTARENLMQNELAGTIVEGDLRTAPLPAGSFDLIISNPPYFPTGAGKSGGSARSEECCTLDELCSAAARLVKNGGRFALCHRPERLTDVLCTLRKYHLEPKRLKLLSHSPGDPPSLILVEALRQGKPGLSIEIGCTV
ncbi:tRNA1(Val) (adenine(37)-N6)-methyltransferase [Lawsonibacter sp. LCP25S3_G6]|uniref:tRNA1(Val) (adenine(37)-N6)-methyltransferase n=1 Tax=unclassified Lawsonibacter TaxID=2617946 RepID=UPI003F956BB7